MAKHVNCDAMNNDKEDMINHKDTVTVTVTVAGDQLTHEQQIFKLHTPSITRVFLLLLLLLTFGVYLTHFFN